MTNKTITAWGQFGIVSGQSISVPADLTNVTAIAASSIAALALKADGTVRPWGDPMAGSSQVPANLNSVKAIAAGWNHGLALQSNGTVAAWGAHWPPHLLDVPADLTNAMVIAAGSEHSLALRSNG